MFIARNQGLFRGGRKRLLDADVTLRNDVRPSSLPTAEGHGRDVEVSKPTSMVYSPEGGLLRRIALERISPAPVRLIFNQFQGTLPA